MPSEYKPLGQIAQELAASISMSDSKSGSTRAIPARIITKSILTGRVFVEPGMEDEPIHVEEIADAQERANQEEPPTPVQRVEAVTGMEDMLCPELTRLGTFLYGGKPPRKEPDDETAAAGGELFRTAARVTKEVRRGRRRMTIYDSNGPVSE